MTSIAGVVGSGDGPAASDIVWSMLALPCGGRRAGPRLWAEDGVCLGKNQALLRPGDSALAPPVLAGDGRFVLVADADLTERQTLAHALGLDLGGQDPAGPDISDDRLIAAAYARWGHDCVTRLSGAFAFAVWDRRDRTLFCARDHLGLRALYHTRRGDGLCVAGSVRALLALPGGPPPLDQTTLGLFLVHCADAGERTWFTGIQRLPPAHRLVWQPGRTPHIARYWSLADAPRLHLPRAEDYADAVRDLLRERAESLAGSGAGLAVQLSGGLDSSSLACLLAQHLRQDGRRLVAVSSVLPAGHQGPEEDERPYIEAVAAANPNIDLHYVTAEDETPFDGLEAGFEALSQPCRHPFDYMTAALWRTAAAHGAQIMVDGYVGDSSASFQHGAVFLDLAVTGRWGRFHRELALLARAYRQPRRRILARALAPLIPDHWFHPGSRINNGGARRYMAISAIRPEFAQQHGIAERLRATQRPLSWPRRFSLGARMQEGLSSSTPASVQEESLALARFAGVGIGRPFLDRRLFELCRSAPLDAIHRDGFGRRLLRDAMAGILPDAVRWRVSKGAFTPDFHHRIARRRDWLLQDLARLEGNAAVRDCLDLDKMRRIVNETARRMSYNGWDIRTQAVVITGHRVGRFIEWAERLRADTAGAAMPQRRGADLCITTSSPG